MICRFCEQELDTEPLIVHLPPNESDPGASPWGHLSCSTDYGYYCPNHDRPHESYGKWHACRSCIEESVELESGNADRYYQLTLEHLNQRSYNRLKEGAEAATVLTSQRPAICALRFVATIAQCKGEMCRTVIQRVIESRNADEITPPPLPI